MLNVKQKAPRQELTQKTGPLKKKFIYILPEVLESQGLSAGAELYCNKILYNVKNALVVHQSVSLTVKMFVNYEVQGFVLELPGNLRKSY